MPLPDSSTALLSLTERQALLALAHRAIESGLKTGKPLQISAREYPAALRSERSSFVTLHRGGALRGCIGHLEAFQPLVKDVAENAFAAAYRDPRFPPLENGELADLDIHVSVLSPPEALSFSSEQSLLDQLQAGVDGLILQQGRHKGTFLPSVWEQLREPADFLDQLKIKAGLRSGFWSDDIQVWRYRTESFS